MDSAERSQFVSGYTKLLTNAWSDEAFMQKVRSNPSQALDEVGLEVPAGVTVTIDNIHSEAEGSLDEQVRLWEEGARSGSITLYVPDVPQIETTELSESELEGVAGGDDVSLCCCCTPCCTG